MLPKPINKKVLKGKALKELNDAIHERENDHCAYCGVAVPRGEKFHHVRIPGLKTDCIEEGICICFKCHNKRHDTGEGMKIEEFCKEYLRNLYPEYWRKRENL